jgi:hypothetical protein
VHGMIDPEEPRRRREELMREAELYRLRKALRANRRRPVVSQRTSTLAWELMRLVGRLRKFIRTTNNAGEDGMDEPRGAYPTNPGSSIPASRISPEDRGGSGDHFAASLGLSRSGCLRFTNGAHRIIIQADSRLPGLYRARFGDRGPIVEAWRGIVTIQYPRFPGDDWLNDRSERPAEVELNASIPWDVELSGGASRLTADLRGLRLGSLKVDGGASRLEVVLPAPSGAVTVVILGGASNVAIRRPEGVAARLRVNGGATNLAFDDRHMGAAAGELDQQSRDYDGAVDRYDIAITGGANNLSIDKPRGTKEGADLDREGK